MKRIWLNTMGTLIISVILIGCGQKEGQESKVKRAVEEVVTKDFKAYEAAKRSLETIEMRSQERREKERELW